MVASFKNDANCTIVWVGVGVVSSRIFALEAFNDFRISDAAFISSIKNQSRKNLAINNYVLQGAQKRFLWAQATAVI